MNEAREYWFMSCMQGENRAKEVDFTGLGFFKSREETQVSFCSTILPKLKHGAVYRGKKTQTDIFFSYIEHLTSVQTENSDIFNVHFSHEVSCICIPISHSQLALLSS